MGLEGRELVECAQTVVASSWEIGEACFKAHGNSEFLFTRCTEHTEEYEVPYCNASACDSVVELDWIECTCLITFTY